MAVAKSQLKCLVADDEPQIGALLRDVLVQQGYQTDVVTDGEAASRKLSEGGYTLLVTDVMMPHKTGVELVHEIRARGLTLPVILMSSHLSEEILVSCSAVERLAFLQKPFALSDLRQAIERAGASVRC
jgi:DNA-binding response OmpR family regulator